MTSLFSFAVTATTETYTLSLHDALPICHVRALVVGAIVGDVLRARAQAGDRHGHPHPHLGVAVAVLADEAGDRKSTRLNSSHTVISYAVFCLKKKKGGIPQ